MDHETIVTSIVVSLGTGLFASLAAPWAHWGVEKRKVKMESRKKLLEECRFFATKFPNQKEKFRATSSYSQIKPYLSKKLIQFIESESIIVVMGEGRGSGVNHFSSDLLDEIQKIERDWDLI